MYTYERIVRVQDTDATGVLYFANQLQIGLEAFEDFLHYKKIYIGEIIERKTFLIPVVHAEGDFFAPVRVSDNLKFLLTFPSIGTSSFTHASEVFKQEKKVGSVRIVHVFYCPTRKTKIPIPQEFREKILESTL